MRYTILILLLLAAVLTCAADTVTLSQQQLNGHDIIKLQNYRVAITIDPARGGAITAYNDRLAPAELILQKPYCGLCMEPLPGTALARRTPRKALRVQHPAADPGGSAGRALAQIHRRLGQQSG